MSGLANLFLGLAVLILSLYLLAPLFGGIFLFAPLIGYGSWIMFALCMKYEAKSIRDKRIGGTKFILANILAVLCLLLWFPYPYNLVAGIVFSFLKVVGYKKLLKNIAESE
jgi:hypothetical protein